MLAQLDSAMTARSLASADEGIRPCPRPSNKLAILTGGGDRPYALGLASALTARGCSIDFVGSDELISSDLLNSDLVNFLNLRGDQQPAAALSEKMKRVLIYYFRLIRYAASAEPALFHILWNNKFEFFDRTLLPFYYKLCGKKLVFTAHNVNIRERDQTDNMFNRWSLKVQYGLMDHVFVHTDKMKGQLVEKYGLESDKVTVIPFGINNTAPNTILTSVEAKTRLGLSEKDKTILFFGNIAPYKGLEFLTTAFVKLTKQESGYRLIIAGRIKGQEDYWKQIQRELIQSGTRDRVIERIEFIPDEETEIYFKAADVIVLPYRHIFQSGVLFLGYSFGLPAIVSDVGSLKDEVVEGKTGFLFETENAADLSGKIRRYFESELYRDLSSTREKIRDYASERYSWKKVAAISTQVYAQVLGTQVCPSL